MNEDERAIYYQEYYSKKKKIINAKRRKRWREDAEYRSTLIERMRKKRISERIGLADQRALSDKELADRAYLAIVHRPAPRAGVIGGRAVVLYPTSFLAKKALRQPETIRRWLRLGVLRHASSVDSAGRLWFTELFCDVIARCVCSVYFVDGRGCLSSLRERIQCAIAELQEPVVEVCPHGA